MAEDMRCKGEGDYLFRKNKITILVVLGIIPIIGSFGVLTYFQSLGSSLGNSINIAGKNRYLTVNLLLQAEWIF